MKSLSAVVVLFLSLAACSGGHCPEGGPVGAFKPPPSSPISAAYIEETPPQKVDIVDVTIVDAARKRAVPMRAYIPEGDTPHPLILFSHGLGSSRNGYAYLGNAWAKAGYVVVYVQHIDSDSSLSLLKLYRASYSPQVWRDRPRDISFIIDQIVGHNAVLERIWKRADVTRIGVGGHSFGAQTALNVAGVMSTLRGETTRVSMKDKRIKAIAPLSVPFMPAARDASYFAPVQVPVLHMTGTKDESPAFDTKLCHKRVPFDWISGPPQYFVVMNGAVHRSFAGEKEAGGENIERYHAEIVEFTTAFWDAYLRGNSRAKEWLDRVAIADGTIERK